MNNKEFIGPVLLFVFIIGFVFVFIPFVPIAQNYSDGERTGEIFKFSKKGLFWKSWEGSMYLGGVSRTSEGGLVLDKFYFSIPIEDEMEKQQIIEDLQECARAREICTIQYDQWLKSPVTISSRYEVTGVIREEL